MFSIMKCHRCGRIFVYYGERKTPHCPSVRCHTMVTKNDKTLLPIYISYSRPNIVDLSSGRFANRVYIYIQVFNNEVNLVADVFSTDGHNYITITLNTDKLNLTTNDLMSRIPNKSKTVTQDGQIVIRSGRYYIDYAPLQAKIYKQVRP